MFYTKIKKKTALAILVWVLIFTLGLLAEILPLGVINNPAYYFAPLLILLFSIFTWFLEDAAEIGFKPSRGLKTGVLLLTVIAIPYYRFKHTGFKKGMLFIVKIVGIYFFLSLLLFMLLTAFGYEEII